MYTNNPITKIQKAIFLLLVLLLPAQLGKHWWPEWSLVNGIRIDYLSPTLYLTDLLVVGIGVIGGIGVIRRKTWGVLGILGIWTAWTVVRAERPMLAIYWLARYAEIGIMAGVAAWGVGGFGGVRGADGIRKALTAGVVFLVGLEIAQIVLGRTTGWFWILGERSFNILTPGIATISLWGKEILRPYATFSHPNALAGYLAVAGMIIWKNWGNKEHRMIGWLAIAGVVLTASRAAILGVTIGVIGEMGGIGEMANNSLILFAPRAAEEREVLNRAGWKMFKDNWLWGAGPGQFLVKLPRYLPSNEKILQPVHNVFLLFLAEFGAIGVIGGIWGIGKIRKVKGMGGILAIILITAMLDHYWLTSQQNRLLLGLVFGILIARHQGNWGSASWRRGIGERKRAKTLSSWGR